MDQKDLKRLLKQELNKQISNIQIFEEGIDIHTQIEFEKKTKLIFEKENAQYELSTLKDILFDKNNNVELKEEILIELSFSPDVKAYRIIEEYHKICENDLKKWSALALQKSRVHIEHSLGNQEKVYISSGLGGSENRLRYFFVLSSNDNVPFNDFQKSIINKELNFTIKKHDGIVESIIFQKYYVTILCMIPLNHSLDTIFRRILEECNILGNFLSDKVIATNTEQFDNNTVEGLLMDDPEITKKMVDFEKSTLEMEQDVFFDDDFWEFDDIFFDDDDEYDDDSENDDEYDDGENDDDFENDDFNDTDILPF